LGNLAPRLVDAVVRAVEDRREEAVRLLQELVRIPSVTGKEGEVQEVVERAFHERGLEVDRWEAGPEEIGPYLDHVGEQERYEGRPNVAGVLRGSAGDAPCSSTRTWTRWPPATLRPGAATR
jgi:acetylornithine deacetylase